MASARLSRPARSRPSCRSKAQLCQTFARTLVVCQLSCELMSPFPKGATDRAVGRYDSQLHGKSACQIYIQGPPEGTFHMQSPALELASGSGPIHSLRRTPAELHRVSFRNSRLSYVFLEPLQQMNSEPFSISLAVSMARRHLSRAKRHL